MKVGRWSTTPGSNNATPPDGWPEGQAASTVNDCAREMMAGIRTVFNDAQFFDQDWTPTYVTTTTFTVPGDQTSAIVAGRRVKLYDSSTIYASVVTASFTALTTIQIQADSGQNLTNSLTSFALAILSTKGIPTNLGTISAAAVIAPATAKAWVRFDATAGGTSALIAASYNISSVSRSGAGIYKVNFTTPMPDINFMYQNMMPNVSPLTLNYIQVSASSFTVAAFKFSNVALTFSPAAAVVTDPVGSIHLVFFDN